MRTKGKSAVPALDRALDIVEAIADGGPMGFSDLLEAVDVPRATAARIVRVLKDRGYLASVDSKYEIAGTIGSRGSRLQVVESLRLLSTPVLESLSASANGVSCLLFVLSGFDMVAVNNYQPEDSISVLEIGRSIRDFGRNPWGWFWYSEFDQAGRMQARKQVIWKPECFDRRIDARINFVREHGFAYDDCEVREGSRRLAAPVRDSRGEAIAMLGIVGSIFDIADADVMRSGKLLIGHANDLAQRI